MLNDSFRHYASDVSLYSFYESRATDLYVRSELIVTKDSAVLGYHHERHAMLDADHRGVCKFESPSDPNYVTVLQALQNLSERILARLEYVSSENIQENWRAMQQIESYLAMPARPDDDLKDLEEARIECSCEWLAERDTFQKWLDPDSEDASIVYWISANPASGKSVLSGYVINAITNLNLDCSYYFFHQGDKDKSTVSGFLRSLLYQLALRNANVRQQLLSMNEKAVRFNKDDSKAIWRKLVWPMISQTSTTTVNYWVLDALDECTGFEHLFTMLATLERRFHIRILITSRKLPEITQKFDHLQRSHSAISVFAEEISPEDTKIDILLYLEGNRYKLHVGDESQRITIINHILEKSEGCFLWVRLVLDELALAWSVGEIQRILDEVPQEMDPLYSRALKIMSSRSKPNRDLTSAILIWILREALQLDLDVEVAELEMAIASLCAQMVHVDKIGRVMIVHLTAKTFLIDDQLDSEFHVDTKLGHLRLATSCLQYLCSGQMKVPRGRRSKTKQSNSQTRSPFARYACLEFAEHLRHTTSGVPAVSSKLYNFLDDNVLSWIEFVATMGNLSILTRTASSINAYVQRHIRSSSPLGEFFYLTQNWAIDLHRIVAGFGPNLMTYPSAIYWLIPPFAPNLLPYIPRLHPSSNELLTHLLSAGRRDIKVWDIDSGFVLWSFEVSHDIMNLAMNEDGKVVMATDKSSTFTSWKIQTGLLDRTVSWSEKMPFLDEVGFRRPPLTAALSPDSSIIAIVYRGRPICLYDLDEDMTHGLVSREGDPNIQGLGSMTSPSSLVFNTKTDNHTFAAAYEDGDLCLFDYEDLTLLKTIEEANAHIVACSPDGLTLVTGNSAGMVQLLEFDTLQLLYRVNAADYGIRGLSFSTDNLRFLDVRGTQCNVWEPAVLGLAKQDESSTEPADWDPIIKGIDNEDLDITSIATEDSGQFFFVGRSDRSLSLHDTTSGKQRKVLYRHNYQISVTSTLWGSQKHMIATSDTACRFIVCALLPDQEVGWKIAAKLMDRRADSMSWQPPPSFSWINHPASPADRMLITGNEVAIFDWTSSSPFKSTTLLENPKKDALSRSQCVKNTFTFAQGKSLVLEMSQLYEEKIIIETLIFNLNSLDCEDGLLMPSTQSDQVGRRVRHVIGGHGSRLLFMDTSRCVSSVDVSHGDSDYYVRHFQIPSDWQSQQRKLLMAVTRNGDILFVRTNDIAVISQGMDFEERVHVGPVEVVQPKESYPWQIGDLNR
ncbi:MAG: hypothetical protein Q9226_006814 [Calogaya cf. arnoldii]